MNIDQSLRIGRKMCIVCGTRKATWRLHFSTDAELFVCDIHLQELKDGIKREVA